jgi:hypothetical protein
MSNFKWPRLLGDIAGIEGAQQFHQPFIFGALQRLQNRVYQQLADVVDALAQQSGQAQEERLLRPLLLGVRVDGAAQELQTAPIVFAVLANQAVILGRQHVELAMHGRHIARLVQRILQLLHNLLGLVQLVEELQVDLALQHFAQPNGLVANGDLLLQLLDELDGVFLLRNVADDYGQHFDQPEGIDSVETEVFEREFNGSRMTYLVSNDVMKFWYISIRNFSFCRLGRRTNLPSFIVNSFHNLEFEWKLKLVIFQIRLDSKLRNR